MPATTPESTSSGCSIRVPSFTELLPEGLVEAKSKIKQIETFSKSLSIICNVNFLKSLITTIHYNFPSPFEEYIKESSAWLPGNANESSNNCPPNGAYINVKFGYVNINS